MAQKFKYKIIFGSESFIIEATRKEVKPETGQIFFYDGSTCNHIIPATALITNVDKELSIIESFDLLLTQWKIELRDLVQSEIQNEKTKHNIHYLGKNINDLEAKINEFRN